MRQLRLRTALIGAGATLALAGGSTAAYALTAGPIDSSGVIHGCYKTAATSKTHAVVLQSAGTACPPGYTAIKWNQKGPAGPRGPAGPGASSIYAVLAAGTSDNITTINAITVNANCEPTGNSNAFYLTLEPPSGLYDATGWVSTSGLNGATPQLISDYQAGGSLQYSATIGSAVDEHVLILNRSTANQMVTFDLQMMDIGFSHCIVWGTATPST
jgi:hypothetical protein